MDRAFRLFMRWLAALAMLVGCPIAAQAETVLRIVSVDSVASSWIASAPLSRSDASVRYGKASGSPAGRGGIGLRNGASACGLTIHGDTLVRKFLARNGPSG